MNTFLHRNVSAALPTSRKVRDIGMMALEWYAARHAIILSELRDAVTGEEERERPTKKLRFCV